MFEKLRNYLGKKKNEKTPLVQEQLVESPLVQVPAPVEPAPVEPAKSNTNPLAYEELVYRDNNNLETSETKKKESTAAYTSDNYRDGYEPIRVEKKSNSYNNHNYDQNGPEHGWWDRGGKKQRKSKKRTTKKTRNSKKRRSNKKR
jgi:hypothetical protein